jgi:hypothetical protein
MKNHISIFILFLLAGCATLTPEQIAEKQAKEISAAREIICVKGGDCEVKWGRAINWVKRESKWKIQIQTDSAIQTLGLDSGDSHSPGFIVMKVPAGNGRFRITMDSSCGCIGDLLNDPSLKASFNAFVLGEVK